MEEEAFYALIETVVARLEATRQERWKWIAAKEAMGLLKIKSKSTLQVLRDSGEIEFSQPRRNIILYDRDSIEKYISKNANHRSRLRV